MINILENRSLLTVKGEGAEHFLETLVTCKVTGLEPGEASFGALLTPQGKILFDFFIIKRTNDFLIDVATDLAADLLKRLTFYKLRAKVDLAHLPDYQVAIFQNVPPPKADITIKDPRNTNMPKRSYGQFSNYEIETDYSATRIKLGVPEGGYDFQYGEAFPHEALMDKNQGVDFKKGCYVGQEVVSRMQHKSTIRKRIIQVSADLDLPETGTEIIADSKPAGVMGTVNNKIGLAMMRLDRAEQAKSLATDGIELTCTRPSWLDIEWPKEA